MDIQTYQFAMSGNKPAHVRFHQGLLDLQAQIIGCGMSQSDPSKVILLTDESVFHPVDYHWPDQPGDVGTIEINGRGLEVADALVVARHDATGAFFIDKEIKAKWSDPGWTFFTGHVIAWPAGPGDLEPFSCLGAAAQLSVEPQRRAGLSLAHTGCHLMSLALNRAAARFFRKDNVPKDSMSNPNLDQLAIEDSSVGHLNTEDTYRFGKSLRKRGFDMDGFLSVLPALVEQMEVTLAGWLKHEHAVQMIPAAPVPLSERRTWVCDLEGAPVTIPCGGTHVPTTSQIRALRLTHELQSVEDGAAHMLVLRTQVTC